jgi:hypothetical protein
MSYAIEQQEWQSLPEHAQREIYDFFLFIKQRYQNHATQKDDSNQTLVFSNHNANLVDDWKDEKEDEIWT